MLVVVAGATGNLGQKLVESLLSRGHQVRVISRNASKLDPALRGRLESFIESSGYDDIPAINSACSGVDAVISTYAGAPELQLEGNLLLLRAAERAGVKRFMPATWNYDWRKLSLGQHESYDAYISLYNHINKSSAIKPIYILCGGLAEVLFSVPGHGDFSPKNHGNWDPEKKRFEIWGTGDEIWHWTTEKDAAEFSAEIIGRDDAAEGGFWSVCSGANTLKEVASKYEEVKGTKVQIDFVGSVEDLRSKALKARTQGSATKFWPYIGYFYQLYTVDGTWTLNELDNGKLNVRTTSLGDFLQSNPSI